MQLGRRDKIPFPESYNGFRLIRIHGRVHAIPLTAQVERILRTPGLLDRHPAVLAAPTLDEVKRLVDACAPGAHLPEGIAKVAGHDIVRHRGAYYAVPENAGAIDLDVPGDRQRAGVIPGVSAEDLERRLRQIAAGAPVEFAGWLPIFSVSGNCGQHPQFKHTGNPPDGYRFTRSAPPVVAPQAAPPGAGGVAARARRLCGKAGAALQKLWYAGRSALSFVFPPKGVSLATRVAVLVAFVRLAALLLRKGCKPGAVLSFLQTRHLQSQLLLGRQELVFLTSMPYTFGQNPWVIEIEDVTTLFYPHVQNGHTCGMALAESPYFPIVRALLEADHCKAILTHMSSTAELIPALFKSAIISKKVVYAPLGVRLPERWQRHDPRPGDEPINLLFINSWCQVPENFYVRGGLDVLEAFSILRKQYPHLRLTIRTALPALDDHYLRIIEGGWVRVVNRFLTDEEMAELHAGSDIFLLPAARVHIVSLLQAMSYGLAVVGSDGWGMEEYLEDGHNGLVVRGRHGKASWADPEAGMLRENYEFTYTPDPEVVAGIVEAVSRLVEDHGLRRRLGRAARTDVRDRYNLDAWNRGLKSALDRARGVAPATPERTAVPAPTVREPGRAVATSGGS
ncbi:glycosyltransferase [Gemmata sp. JC673]|uniref:Glycosyltransferase n=1 Tax=Gemmata algarum TaxID=2975278 RepID=A0ABU5F804_9BACT|nr:glycosyltransferase [Gemmata algarum]MDY3563662.1 glycosyltransferase [Gemmata algarum]